MADQHELTRVMETLFARTGRATGYWPNRFHGSVLRNGGLPIAKRLLTRQRGRSTGFQKLADAGRADLSVEAIALRPEFAELFTDEEISVARERLESLPPSAFPKVVLPAKLHPDELSEDEDYEEGGTARVLVNRYERDPRARAACLRHHGYLSMLSVQSRLRGTLRRDRKGLHSCPPSSPARPASVTIPCRPQAPSRTCVPELPRDASPHVSPSGRGRPEDTIG